MRRVFFTVAALNDSASSIAGPQTNGFADYVDEQKPRTVALREKSIARRFLSVYYPGPTAFVFFTATDVTCGTSKDKQ
jgi:hypothetical protein